MYLKSVSGDVIYEGRFYSVRHALESAVRERMILDGINLRGCNIAGAQLDGASMKESDCWGVNLANTNLSGSDLRGSDFRNANMKDSCFASSNCTDSDFRGVYFSKTIFDDANLSECLFSCPSLFSVDLSAVKNLKDAKYVHLGELECDLSSAPLVFKGFGTSIVMMKDCALVGNTVKRMSYDDVVAHLYNYFYQQGFLNADFQNAKKSI